MQYNFKYDSIADVLWTRSPEMDLLSDIRKAEVKEFRNMSYICYDRFTKKVIGARLTGFNDLLTNKLTDILEKA
jgi:hypothetical protein